MARLPDPITEELRVDWDDGYEAMKKNFYSMIGQSVRSANREILRKAELEKKREDDKNESN